MCVARLVALSVAFALLPVPLWAVNEEAVHRLESERRAEAEPPSKNEKSWKSVGNHVQEQAAKVVEWAKDAETEAARAGADAQQVSEAATKASSSMTNVLAEVGAAKSAMNQALLAEKKISTLKDRMWERAKAAAMGEIPAVLSELKDKAQKKAEEEAKKKAEAFEKQMKNKARSESAKAAKVYTDLMDGAGKSAADFAAVGDNLISQSAQMQVSATLAQNQAGQQIGIGAMSEGQKLLQQSRSDMNMALGLNSQATGMYDKANSVTAQLPAYAAQAAAAAYHAQSMYDPEAQPPPPPLVLAQK